MMSDMTVPPTAAAATPPVHRRHRSLLALSATLVCAQVLAACGPTPPRVETPADPPDAASTAATPGAASAAATPAARPMVVPAGMTAGIVVFDRQRGQVVTSLNPSMRFRSASLVKLLIVLDYLWERGPDYTIPAADRARLDAMLRSSDDSAGSHFWKRAGQRAIVTRMVYRLSLQESAPPPAHQPGYWGYTALSAADTVRVYRHLLEVAPGPVRQYVLGNLRQATRCGTDRFDQSFGIPSVVARPWAVKQAWSGFGGRPPHPCTSNAAAPGGVVMAPARAASSGPDMLGEVLHTTGTVGDGDRFVVALLSVHRDGTTYPEATAALTELTRTLPELTRTLPELTRTPPLTAPGAAVADLDRDTTSRPDAS